MIKCPVCGYTEPVPGKKQSMEMNHYVNKLNPKDIVVMNESSETITIKSKVEGRPDITYIRKDAADKTPTPKATVSASPKDDKKQP